MSADQVSEIAPLIREVFNHVSEKSANSEALCATFEVVGESDAWAQVTSTELNVSYPRSHSPEGELREIIQKLPSAQLLSWEPMKFATWSFVSVTPTEIAKVVDQVLAKLFNLDDYSLNGQIVRL